MITPDLTNLARCADVLRHNDLDLIVAADPCTVAYLTGHAPAFEAGPNPWAGGPTLAVLSRDQVCLIAADGSSSSQQRDDWTVIEHGYPAYTYQYPLESSAAFRAALCSVVASMVPMSARIGVEDGWVPASVRAALADCCPHSAIASAAGLFDEVRMVKSQRELALLREAVRLGDEMQHAVRRLAVPGRQEIEVFSLAKAHMEQVAGGRVPVRAALRGGCGSAEVWQGDPHSYILREGDMLLSDLLPQWQGYWSDSCSTTVVGGAPSALQLRMHRIAREALDAGIEAARPGISAGDLDRRVRDVVARYGYAYPHHTGHGIGVGLHEPPFIWKDAPTVLAPGMVIALEPGVYVPEVGGVRQEVSLLITADGAEVLSHNALTL
jgi:Xaa-Pro dipeptidase